MICKTFFGKEVFVFDWDGTLFDSMEAKTSSFGGVISQCLGQRTGGLTRELAEALYRQYSGRPRKEIFGIIAAKYGLHLTDADMEDMSQQVTNSNKITLAEALLFDDGLRLLPVLMELGHTLYVSSSVPQKELEMFFNAKMPLQIRNYFRGVFGSSHGFAKGIGHFERITKDTGCHVGQCLMFGDDLADMALSQMAGVDGILVDRAGRHAGEFPHSISSFHEVIECLYETVRKSSH